MMCLIQSVLLQDTWDVSVCCIVEVIIVCSQRCLFLRVLPLNQMLTVWLSVTVLFESALSGILHL